MQAQCNESTLEIAVNYLTTTQALHDFVLSFQ
ncbi:MAG: hypothetical protein ACI9WC_001972 [Arenicella sp.]|jgi:hypothetical protein